MAIAHTFRVCFAGVLLFVSATFALCNERILLFDVALDVQDDGRLSVTEQITVQATGEQIKRGIFRDIPLTARDANGWIYDVGFELIEVQQDGVKASYFTERNAAGIRIYIGQPDVFLEPGRYTYMIRYDVTRQVRFFDAYDEIYWNVTGNEWVFAIDYAIARVRLPQEGEVAQLAAYTGVFGADGTDYEVSNVPRDGYVATVRTTRPLDPGEGLTVAVGFAKGLVQEPNAEEKLWIWINDQRVVVIGSVGLLILSLYYLVTWFMVGRDLRAGVIIPRFEAPAGVSPALALYIQNRGLGDKIWLALTAACLNLAVRDRLIMKRDGATMSIDLKGDNAPLSADSKNVGEATILEFLRKRERSLALIEFNGSDVHTLGRSFSSALRKEHRNVFFKNNGWFLVPGLLGSALAIASLILFGNLSEARVDHAILFGFLSVFALAFSVGIALLLQTTLVAWKWPSPPRGVFWIIFVPVLALWLYGVALLTSVSLSIPTSFPMLPAFIIAIVLLFVLYASILSAPTALGRRVLDEIEGLRLYLTVAEKDRLNMIGTPEMSVPRFERLLPYAVALGVEKPWSEQFSAWLEGATNAADRSYDPRWYSGDDFDSRSLSDSISKTAGGFAGSFQTSLPQSSGSSSGSSGGGSSGGGGGGGGGGGW